MLNNVQVPLLGIDEAQSGGSTLFFLLCRNTLYSKWFTETNGKRLEHYIVKVHTLCQALYAS